MTKFYILYMAICTILNIILAGVIALKFYKERSPKMAIQYISNVVEDGGKFYIKIIYNDKYTDTYTFKTRKVAEAFRQSMLVVYTKNKSR